MGFPWKYFCLLSFFPRAVVVEAWDSHAGKRCRSFFSLLCTRKETEEQKDSCNQTYIVSICSPATQHTLSPFGQLSGEQHIGQLALGIGSDRVVPFCSIQVIELDLAHGMSGRWQVDNPGWGRVLQQVQQEEGQKEVTWVGRDGVEVDRKMRNSEQQNTAHRHRK